MSARTFSGEAGVRLDVFLWERLDGVTRSFVQKLIERGSVRVEGRARPAGYKLREGESVVLELPEAPPAPKIEVLFEDDGLLLVDKPAGLIVHPAGETWLSRPETALNESEPSLVGWLVGRRPESASLPRCGLVHRLDRETSGVLALAKTPQALEDALAQFRARTVEKLYWAIVEGEMPAAKGSIDAPVGRVGGKLVATPYGRESQSEYRVLKQGKKASLVEVKPRTGRTHQIRVHLAAVGRPVLGDLEHGGRKAERLYLHARRLKLKHGAKTVQAESEPPAGFLAPLE